jgi:hypothetical protein
MRAWRFDRDRALRANEHLKRTRAIFHRDQFAKALLSGEDVTHWTEWRVLVKHFDLHEQPTLKDMIFLLEPPVPSYLRPPQHGSSGARRRKYHRSLRKWLAPFGGAYWAFIRNVEFYIKRILYDRISRIQMDLGTMRELAEKFGS